MGRSGRDGEERAEMEASLDFVNFSMTERDRILLISDFRIKLLKLS